MISLLSFASINKMSQTRKQKLIEGIQQKLDDYEKVSMETTAIKSKAQRIREGLDEVHAMMQELTDTKLIFMGKEYALSEWMTVSDYAAKYNMKADLVLKWIDRGVIPAGSAIVIPELNYLKLVKNEPYSARPYEVRATK